MCLYFLKTSWTNIKPLRRVTLVPLTWKTEWVIHRFWLFFSKYSLPPYPHPQLRSTVMVERMYFPTPWLVLTDWILEDSMLWSLKYAHTVRLVASHCCVSVWACLKCMLMLVQRKCEIVGTWTNAYTGAQSNWTQLNPAPPDRPADCEWEIKSLSLRCFYYVIIVKRMSW